MQQYHIGEQDEDLEIERLNRSRAAEHDRRPTGSCDGVRGVLVLYFPFPTYRLPYDAFPHGEKAPSDLTLSIHGPSQQQPQHKIRNMVLL